MQERKTLLAQLKGIVSQSSKPKPKSQPRKFYWHSHKNEKVTSEDSYIADREAAFERARRAFFETEAEAEVKKLRRKLRDKQKKQNFEDALSTGFRF